MSSADIYRRFSKQFPGFAERLEAIHPPGIPDVHWMDCGRAGFIELKWNDPEVRADQAIWMWKYTRAGGRAGVLAVLNKRLVFARWRWGPTTHRYEPEFDAGPWTSRAQDQNWGEVCNRMMGPPVRIG